MKSRYHLGGDFFIACAFVSFVVAVMLRLMGIFTFWGLNVEGIFKFSVSCLLFSIALSLLDLTNK